LFGIPFELLLAGIIQIGFIVLQNLFNNNILRMYGKINTSNYQIM